MTFPHQKKFPIVQKPFGERGPYERNETKKEPKKIEKPTKKRWKKPKERERGEKER
jgi:hypothetical protein